jgi:hypothetical protein
MVVQGIYIVGWGNERSEEFQCVRDCESEAIFLEAKVWKSNGKFCVWTLDRTDQIIL